MISDESQAALDRGDRQRATGEYKAPQGPSTKVVTKGDAQVLDKIIDYESGAMTFEDRVPFFQQLVDSGLAWQLQGSYGRMANYLIETGLVTRKGGQ